MEAIQVHIAPEDIPIDPSRIMSLPEMASSKEDPFTLELLDSMIVQSRGAFSPRGIFLPGETQISRFSMGSTLDKMLRNSEYYAFFIATAGPGPEELARDFLEQGSYLEGYLCDLIASVLAEGVAEQVHQAIRSHADSQDIKITNRYSPGYCSWDVAEQHILFALFGEQTCGVELSESALMTPVKSVSGVVGMGREVKFRDYTCELCNKTDCVYRSTRANPH